MLLLLENVNWAEYFLLNAIVYAAIFGAFIFIWDRTGHDFGLKTVFGVMLLTGLLAWIVMSVFYGEDIITDILDYIDQKI